MAPNSSDEHGFYGGFDAYEMIMTIAAIGLLGGTAVAQEGTLKKIKDTGTITIGHRESSIPFSYYDDKQQVVGYAMDLCNKIVDAVKKDLKLAKLDVKLQPVTSATRIPLIANGTVDLECGSTTNNLDRQKQVSFTITHFVTANRFVSKKVRQAQDARRPQGQDRGLDLRHHQHQADHRAQHREKSRPEHPAGQGSRRGLPDGGNRPRRCFRDGRHPALQPGRIHRRRRAITKFPPMHCRSSLTASCCARTIRRSRKWSMTP